nr:EAL domain-containing protein [uncultured Neokomagataea sp.]
MLTLFDAEYAQLVLRALDYTAGVIITDSSGHILSYNNKFTEIIENSNYKPNINSENDLIQNIKILSNNQKNWHGEICHRKNNGIISWADLTIVPYFHKERDTTFYISICFDVTLRKTAEEHLRANKSMLQKALTIDPLTGISNRIAFSNHIKNISQDKTDKLLICIYMIDIDSFKIANDTLGHKAGDKLLKKISTKLNNLQSNTTLAARMGGDEFAVITTGLSEKDFSQQINYILTSLNFLFSFNGLTHHTTASIGYAIANGKEKDIHNTLYLADLALYQAKAMGGNCAYAYSADLKHKHDDRNRLRSSILNNLEQNDFLIKYQPIINISSAEIVATNSILQCPSPKNDWNIEDLQNIADDITIDRALTQIAFDAILKDIQSIKDSISNEIRVSLKIPTKNIIHTQLISRIMDGLIKYSIPPQGIILEIDTNIINNTKNNTIQRDISALRKMGVKIMLSGFGKEKTYLMPLKDIEYDYTKIDATLIKSLPSSAINHAITKSLIDITHAMGKKIIAEGVETPQCADILAQLGCDFAQGIFYSPPLTLKQLEKKLQTSTSPFR